MSDVHADIHADILKALRAEANSMNAWAKRNTREVIIDRILNTEEGASELMEIGYRLEAIFKNVY